MRKRIKRILAAIGLLGIALGPIGAFADQSVPFWPANTPGGGCTGITSGGVQIPTKTQFFQWSTTTTKILSGTVGKIGHICGLYITGQSTAGGVGTIITGTHTTTDCDTTASTIGEAYIAFTAAVADSIYMPMGSGANTIADGGTGLDICLGGVTFTGTILVQVVSAFY